MNKKNVAVIFGSMSSEHEISCVSASNVINNINQDKYNVEKIGIDKSGIWFFYNGDVKNILENKWMQDESHKSKIDDIMLTLKKFDVVFPVLHGKYGEDGTIQGIFEMSKVKYVGCKVLGSSISMDKTFSKEIARFNKIPIVPFIALSKSEFEKIRVDELKFNNLCNDIVSKLSLPVFIKPNREGSSYGIKKVTKIEDLKDSIEFSLKFDNNILIEKYISEKKEVECAVIENGGNIISSTPGEIVILQDVYDFDSKYNDKTSYTKIPAQISDKTLKLIQEYSKVIFRSFRLNQLARVDFFVTKDENVYFNEVNTMPGFTDISMYPKMLIHDGYSYQEIIDVLIENAT